MSRSTASRPTLTLDGSAGEGGGQVLRTALTLAVLTERPVALRNIRAGRPRPGLGHQHLAAARAAAEVCGGRLEGNGLGSRELRFVPGATRGGSYRFGVGTAGSATLVLQTVLLPLCFAPAPSQVVLEGGTHNPHAPPFEFLERAFLPLIARMGARVRVGLERAGFYPAGGGRMLARIEPAPRLQPFRLLDRGDPRGRRVEALISNLPASIAERETAGVLGHLGREGTKTRVRRLDGAGPGNVVLIEIRHEHVTEVFTGFGQRGVRAETVARRAAAAAATYLAADVPVGPHLADQLLLPLAIAGGGAFRTVAPTAHTRTNAAIIERFLDVAIELNPEERQAWRVAIRRRPERQPGG